MNSRKTVEQRTRYRIVNGQAFIELQLRTPRQLFDERDPAPFRERDLDDDAARYILNSFRDLRDYPDVKLSLYFESLDDFSGRPHVITDAIRTFFAFESQVKRRELIDIFRQGLFSLFIGLTFLFSLAYFASGLDSKPGGFWGSLFHEGLHLLGWVSMWKPISIFLYEWWPIRASLVTYERLANIEVDVIQNSASLEQRQAEANFAVAPLGLKTSSGL